VDIFCVLMQMIEYCSLQGPGGKYEQQRMEHKP
jgi:hypothetical protein